MSTSNNIRHLLGGGALYTIATGVQAASAFVVLPIITRQLEPQQFGSIVSATLIIQLLTLVSAFGLQGEVTRTFFDQAGKTGARRLAWLASCLSLITCGVVATVYPVWAGLLFEDPRAIAPIAALSGVPTTVITLCQAVLRAQHARTKFVFLAAATAIVAPFAGVAFLGLSGKHHAATYVLGQGLANLLIACVALMACGSPFACTLSKPFAKHLIVSLPTVPHLLALFALAMGDRVIIQAWGGSVAVAQYHIGYVVGAVPIVVANAMNQAWAPAVYELKESKTLYAFLSESTTILTKLFSFFSIALCSMLPVIISIVAPSTYDRQLAIQIAAIVGLSGIPMVRYLAHVHRLFWARTTTALAITTPVAVTIALALTVPLVRQLGPCGAALTTVVGYILQAAMTRTVASRISVSWKPPSIPGVAILAMACATLRYIYPSHFVVTVAIAGAAVAMLLTNIQILRKRWSQLAASGIDESATNS